MLRKILPTLLFIFIFSKIISIYVVAHPEIFIPEETPLEEEWAPRIIQEIYPDTGELVTLVRVHITKRQATYSPSQGTGDPANLICIKYPDKCVKKR